MKNVIAFLLSSASLFAATGSWNGVAFTAWNGVAQTAWNGTAISCAGGGGGVTITFIGAAVGTEVSDDENTVTKVMTTGNSVFVCLKWEDIARTPTLTDSSGNTYTAVRQSNISGNAYAAIYKAENITGGAGVVVTAQFGGVTGFTKMGVWEFHASTGFPTIDDADGEIGSGTGTAVATASLTTSTASGGLVCVVARYNAGTLTPGTGWTEDSDADALYLEHRITTSAAGYVGDATISVSQIWVAVIAAFK